ncbi:MAG: response regulator [Ferruginibacter sp.]
MPDRILLVEDDKDDQALFCEALSCVQPALSCQIANNGVEALDLIRQLPPFDIIFMDLNMPKMNGFECLKYLKDSPLFKHIPVIIISTSSHQFEIERCKQLGAAMYFTKPASFKELFDKLKNVLSKDLLN